MNNRLLLKLNISTVTYYFYIFQMLAHLINIFKTIIVLIQLDIYIILISF